MHTYLTRRQAAEYLTHELGLPTSWRSLQKWATTGGGPPYRRFGNKAVYLVGELEEWAEAKISPPQLSTSTPYPK